MKIVLNIVNDRLIQTNDDNEVIDFILIPNQSMSEVLERIDSKINFDKVKIIELAGSFTSYTTERNFTAVINTLAQVKKIKLIRDGSTGEYIQPIYSGGANVTIR